MYLVVLALLFSFIPSDFVDTVMHSERTMQKMITETEKNQSRANLMFLKFLENDEFVYNETKGRMIAVEDKTVEILDYIEDIRERLIRSDEIDKNGYLKRGKREEIPNDIMIDKKLADSLMDRLAAFKTDIRSFLPLDALDQLDTILPLPDMIVRSNGKKSAPETFFFSKTPLNITLLNLSHFEAQIEHTKSFTIEQIIREAFRLHADRLPFDVRTILESADKNIRERTAIKDFFGQLEVAELLSQLRKKKRESNAYLHVQSLTDSIYPAGRPLRFKIYFDSIYTEKVIVKVNNQYGFTEYVLHRPGDFIYIPERKGTYSIQFSNQQFTTVKSFSVIDVEPVIQNEKYGTLYVGIENALKIQTSEFEDTRNLIARTNNGQVFKRGANFFVKVDEKKLTKVQIYTRMPYGLVKIAEKEFLVKDIDLPIIALGDLKYEAVVPASDLKTIDKILLKDQNTGEENRQYGVIEFDLSLIYNDHTSITPPIHHRGPEFNREARQILSNAKSGDIILLNNLVLRGPDGISNIPSGISRVKVQ